MAGTDPGSAREEAERLVATVLAAARLAAASGQQTVRAAGFGQFGDMISGVFGHNSAGPTSAGTSGGGTASGGATSGGPTEGGTANAGTAGDHTRTAGFATGGAECCVCPVCRGMTALRDPSPEFAERLATGAGEVAAGVAKLLRAFGEATGTPGSAGSTPGEGSAPGRGATPGEGPATDEQAPTAPRGEAQADEVWREATRTGHDSGPTPERDVWAAATHAGARIRPGGATPPADVAGPAGLSHPPATRPTTEASAPAAGTAHAESDRRPAVPPSRTPEEPGAADESPGDGD